MPVSFTHQWGRYRVVLVRSRRQSEICDRARAERLSQCCGAAATGSPHVLSHARIQRSADFGSPGVDAPADRSTGWRHHRRVSQEAPAGHLSSSPSTCGTSRRARTRARHPRAPGRPESECGADLELVPYHRLAAREELHGGSRHFRAAGDAKGSAARLRRRGAAVWGPNQPAQEVARAFTATREALRDERECYE